MTSESQLGDFSEVMKNRPLTSNGRNASSRDMLSFMDTHLVKCEVAVGEMREQFEDTEERIKRLNSIREEIK